MNKRLRISLYVLAALLVIFIGVLIVVPLLVNPNDFKPQITALVEDKTGRSLTIDGELELSLFPWIGVGTGRLEVGNAAGFEDETFVAVERVQIRIKLLPLLSKNIEIGQVVVQGFEANLRRNAAGVANWDDLVVADEATPPEAPEPGASEINLLRVNGVLIEDGQLSFVDEQAGLSYSITDLGVETSAIAPGEAIEFSMGLNVNSAAPVAEGRLALAGTVGFDPEAQRYRVQSGALEFAGRLPEFIGSDLDAELKWDLIQFDGAAQSLDVEGLLLEALGMTLRATVTGKQVIDAPQFAGVLESETFSPTRLLVNLGQEAVPTADPEVLSEASLATKFSATPNSIAFSDLQMKLDQTTLSGNFAITDLGKQALRFDLVLDSIDADRYLPPAEEDTQTEEGGEPLNAMELPVDPVRNLDVQGRMRIESLRAFSMNTSNVDFSINAGGGVLRVNPAKAELYEGTYSGNIVYRVDGANPLIAVDENLANVQIGGMSQDLFKEDRISGTTGMQIKLRGAGKTVGEVRANFNGNLSFALQDGAVTGVDLTSALKNAYAIAKGQKSEASGDTQGKTEFAELKGSGPVRNGIWRTNDLAAEVLNVVANGSGTVNLATEALDLELKTTIKPKRANQEGLDIPELENVPIVIPVQCELSAPCMRLPKVSEALKAKARQQLQQKRQQLEEEKKDEVEDKVKDKLKDLFGG